MSSTSSPIRFESDSPTIPAVNPFSPAPINVAGDLAPAGGDFALRQRSGHLLLRGYFRPVYPAEQLLHNLSPIPGPQIEEEEGQGQGQRREAENQRKRREVKATKDPQVLRRSARIAARDTKHTAEIQVLWRSNRIADKLARRKGDGTGKKGPEKKGPGKKGERKKGPGKK
ncbi:hypothetical protein RUND412_000083 [Rhizina undulata]